MGYNETPTILEKPNEEADKRRLHRTLAVRAYARCSRTSVDDPRRIRRFPRLEEP